MNNSINWISDANSDATLDGVNLLAFSGYCLVYQAEDQSTSGFESSLATDLE